MADIRLGSLQHLRHLACHPSGEFGNPCFSEHRANEGCARFDPFRCQMFSNFCIGEVLFEAQLKDPLIALRPFLGIRRFKRTECSGFAHLGGQVTECAGIEIKLFGDLIPGFLLYESCTEGLILFL